MIRLPVYSEENNLPYVTMYEEDVDGTFKRTQLLPLRQLHDNIDGISNTQGDLIAPQFDKVQHSWNSPSINFHYGRPQSHYAFLREKVALNRFYVFVGADYALEFARIKA